MVNIKKNSKKKLTKKINKKNSKINSKNKSKKKYKLSRTAITTLTTDFNYNYDKVKNDKTIIIKKIEYPYLKYFTTENHIINTFNNLKKFTCKIVNENYNFTTLNINDIKFKNPKNNKVQPFLIIDEPYEYTSIEVISDYFNEECRVRCKFASAPGTQLDFFKNNFDKVIDYIQTKNLKITFENMRETIWHIGFKECSTFKPKLEKFFIEFFNARKILDLSSGWGDRLIGAMASDIDCYHGFDPNPCLHPNYKNIIKTLKNYQVNKNAVYIIKKQPFENATLKPNYYDLMMTSPPYFTMEIYDNNPSTFKTQSISNIHSEKEWFDNLLLVWIDKIYTALRKDGILALNINQFRNQNYVYWLLNDMNKNKSKYWKYLGIISHSAISKKNPQPTFIWTKI
jgi:hypothetical protein